MSTLSNYLSLKAVFQIFGNTYLQIYNCQLVGIPISILLVVNTQYNLLHINIATLQFLDICEVLIEDR